jgi:hypothetical protein
MDIQSILDGFYEAVLTRLTTLVPKIKHFDIYYGQYDSPEVDADGNTISLPFNRPAAFFEWPKELPLIPLGLKRKATDFIFTIHLVQDVVQEIDKRTTVAIRQKAHLHTALINEVMVALEGFNGDLSADFKHFSSIGIAGIMPYTFSDQQIIHKIGFRARIVVDAAKQFYTKLEDLEPPVQATEEVTNTIEQL